MPAGNSVKPAGGTVRIRRERAGAGALESDWTLVRIEPESGNVVCERGDRRIVCRRSEFEALNFPGSDDVWMIISDHDDDDLAQAKDAWSKLDLRGASASLIKFARKLDPEFSGVQTAFDLAEKIRAIESVCKRSMDLLRLEIKKARLEHERFAARTALENDRRDDLLARVRELEDKYAARAYRYGTRLPEWRRLLSAIESMDAKSKNE